MFWEPLIWRIQDQKSPNMLRQMPTWLWENISYDRFRKNDNFCVGDHQIVLVDCLVVDVVVCIKCACNDNTGITNFVFPKIVSNHSVKAFVFKCNTF